MKLHCAHRNTVVILTGEHELKRKVALRHLLPKCISAMLRMLALQFYSRRSATRNNIETSVVEEVRRTVQCVAVVRGKCLALQNVTRCLKAATNAIILLPVANLTRSGHTGQLEKIPDTVTKSTTTVFERAA